MSTNNLGFSGSTKDAIRNVLQAELANSIGNARTASASIENAVRIETFLFDRCADSMCAEYVNGSTKILQMLRDGNAGLFVQQKLLQGDMPPEKWLETALPELAASKKVAKKAVKKAVSTTTTTSTAAATYSEAKSAAAAPSSSPTPPSDTADSTPSSESSSTDQAAAVEEEDKKKMMNSNPYYFGRKITSDAQAESYKPKKLDASAVAAKVPSQHEQQGFSAFNAAKTWEERDLTVIARDLLEKRLGECDVKVEGMEFSKKDWTISGDYAVAVGKRGKSASFEFKCKCSFTATYTVGGEEVAVEGTLGEFMLDDVDGEDMDYDVTVDISKPSKNDKKNHPIRALLRKEMQKIKQTGFDYIEEMKAQYVK
jgi:DNA polymerase III gamma/tau subunit